MLQIRVFRSPSTSWYFSKLSPTWLIYISFKGPLYQSCAIRCSLQYHRWPIQLFACTAQGNICIRGCRRGMQCGQKPLKPDLSPLSMCWKPESQRRRQTPWAIPNLWLYDIVVRNPAVEEPDISPLSSCTQPDTNHCHRAGNPTSPWSI